MAITKAMTSYKIILGDFNGLLKNQKIWNDTHKEKAQFSTRIFWNIGLAASDLSHIFIQ